MRPDKVITSASNPVVKSMASLAMKKYRDEQKAFVVEGLRDVAEAVSHGFSLRALAYDTSVIGDPSFNALHDACPSTIDVYIMTKDLLGKITHRDNPQAVIGVFEQRLQELTDIKKGIWVVLEGVRDPGNLGTIIRTVDAVGAEGVILVGETCDLWSPETIRATMGSFAHVPVARTTLDMFLEWRHTFNGKMIGTHLQTDVDYRDTNYGDSVLLAMGSEQSGLSGSLKEACDLLVKIPMAGKAESLNLAVSTGIFLYETRRQKLTLK